MPRVLIIAYGNPLRSDDGIGWHAAQLLQQKTPPLPAEIICAHQLMPELAEMASRADCLIFLDASCNGEPGQIVCTELRGQPQMSRFSHQQTPGQILSLCQELYGVCPKAYAISIAGESFDHGEALTECVRAALPPLIRTVEECILGQTESAIP